MLTQELLKEWLYYDPNTGLFIWIKRGNGITIGKLAGSFEDGYIRIRVCGKRYLAHRLAWLYMIGEWPEEEIDHIDTVGYHNWWSNLRKSTRSENMKNTNIGITNTTGFKGVTYRKKAKKYVAMICLNRKNVYLGWRDTAEEAYQLYCEAADKHYKEFARY